ncbi:hypothetical protein [Treponema sp.]|uniref:hypothetical protein n=1 Tax=Treponema sp. TaxID=166 RepID=UPI003FD86611
MKTINTCFNTEQINALRLAGIKLPPIDRELTEDEYGELVCDLIDEVTFQTDERHFDEKHQDFWFELWDRFQKYFDD